MRTFELFEPLRLFLKTNLEGSKDSKNLEGVWILDTQQLLSLCIRPGVAVIDLSTWGLERQIYVHELGKGITTKINSV